jgi:hypothetical protein
MEHWDPTSTWPSKRMLASLRHSPAQPSADAVALFRRCVAIENVQGAAKDWEPVGRRREYLDTAHALHMALNRTLRDIEVLSVRDYDTAPPSWMHRGNHASWFEAQRLRRAILAATNPTRPPG